VRGARLTSLGQAVYHESIVVEESDGAEHRYRIDGDMSVCEQGDETDFGAVACGLVSITPLRIDWHDPAAAATLAAWDLERLVLAAADDGDPATSA
jgi:broad specificity polyphosphatase/5'/3'-nucleotidase SurE